MKKTHGAKRRFWMIASDIFMLLDVNLKNSMTYSANQALQAYERK